MYAAYVARAHFAEEAGDHQTQARYLERARQLKEAFNQDFWLEERGWFALGLDADKRPIDALATNMGHCLWTGIVDDDKAPRGRRAAAVARAVHRLGHPHAGHVDAGLQPGHLPQRLGVAARQTPCARPA